MLVDSCIPVIPSADLEKSLRFWVDGLGLTMGQKRLARARERHALALRALAEELGAERPFEGNQRFRHRRLRHAEAARGARVPARFDDGHEGAQVAELELGSHRLIFLLSPPDGSRVPGQ